MAEISNVINVQLQKEGALAEYNNINVVALITTERGKVLSSNNRYVTYKTASAVATDFGANSQTADFANAFFGTSPNPISVDGMLVIGYWRSGEEVISASAANITGLELSEATVLSSLQSITDGNFKLSVDGKDVAVNGLNFNTVTSLSDVVSVISSATNKLVASLNDLNQIVLTSKTTGASSTITALSSTGTGTFIGAVLGLSDGGGAIITDGADAVTLTAETKLDAVTNLKANVSFYGATFIDQPTSAEALSLAAWSKANNVIMYDVFKATSNLEVNTSNVVWNIKLAEYTTYRCLFSKSGNRKFAVSYMARNHVVNFSAENSAITMHLKNLSITAESYTESELSKAKAVGLDVYTTVKNLPCVLTSGANDYVDNVYNLMSYIDAVQTDAFNVLKATATKLGQTVRDVNKLISVLENTSIRYRRANFIGAGTWSSPDYFGSLEVFNRAIEKNGFYWMAGSLSDQSQVDRVARKSPTLQNAIKNAGAIHSADIIINFNY